MSSEEPLSAEAMWLRMVACAGARLHVGVPRAVWVLVRDGFYRARCITLDDGEHCVGFNMRTFHNKWRQMMREFPSESVLLLEPTGYEVG